MIPLTNGHGPQIGDPCPREACNGVLGVYSTKVIEEANVRVRYLRCNSCKARPSANQQVVPLKYAPPRIIQEPIAIPQPAPALDSL